MALHWRDVGSIRQAVSRFDLKLANSTPGPPPGAASAIGHGRIPESVSALVEALCPFRKIVVVQFHRPFAAFPCFQSRGGKQFGIVGVLRLPGDHFIELRKGFAGTKREREESAGKRLSHGVTPSCFVMALSLVWTGRKSPCPKSGTFKSHCEGFRSLRSRRPMRLT